jgi:ABC-type multidrug transport system fused ATPase/permease subunit
MIALGLYTDWKITLVTLAIVPIYAFLSWYIGKKANEAYEKSNTQADLLFGRFSDILTNITAVRVFGGYERSLSEIR